MEAEAEVHEAAANCLVAHALPRGYSLHVMMSLHISSELWAEIHQELDDPRKQVIKVPGWCAFKVVLKERYTFGLGYVHPSVVEIQLPHTSIQSFLYQVLKYNFPGKQPAHTHCCSCQRGAPPDVLLCCRQVQALQLVGS